MPESFAPTQRGDSGWPRPTLPLDTIHCIEQVIEAIDAFAFQEPVTAMSAGVKIGHSTLRERCVAAE
jgi:hypothetical protein